MVNAVTMDTITMLWTFLCEDRLSSDSMANRLKWHRKVRLQYDTHVRADAMSEGQYSSFPSSLTAGGLKWWNDDSDFIVTINAMNRTEIMLQVENYCITYQTPYHIYCVYILEGNFVVVSQWLCLEGNFVSYIFQGKVIVFENKCPVI